MGRVRSVLGDLGPKSRCRDHEKAAGREETDCWGEGKASDSETQTASSAETGKSAEAGQVGEGSDLTRERLRRGGGRERLLVEDHQATRRQLRGHAPKHPPGKRRLSVREQGQHATARRAQQNGGLMRAEGGLSGHRGAASTRRHGGKRRLSCSGAGKSTR